MSKELETLVETLLRSRPCCLLYVSGMVEGFVEALEWVDEEEFDKSTVVHMFKMHLYAVNKVLEKKGITNPLKTTN